MRRLFHLLDIWRRANERLLPSSAASSPVPAGRVEQEYYVSVTTPLVWTGLPPTGSGSRYVRVSVLTNNASGAVLRKIPLDSVETANLAEDDY
ncbi:unnamed protein product [Lasius platythorax]|uniref:Uncharacterized protein n=1 Tax=Lasius platythorax TaxID=488582 RepID=A0AAV2NP55_9HYME